MQQNLIIYTLSAVAGAGKTRVAATYSLDYALRNDRKTIIAGPTVAWARQVEADLKAVLSAKSRRSIEVTRLDSSNTDNVGRAILQHFQDAAALNRRDKGEILVVTQAGYMQCPHFHGAQRWELIVDEIPSSSVNWRMNLPENHRIITDICELEDSDGAYARVRIKKDCKAQLERMEKNVRRDEFWNALRPILSALTSPHWAVEAHVESWHRTISGDVEPYPVREAELARYPLWLFAQMLPSMVDRNFNCVTIMGAAFDETVLAKIWSAHGVTFKPHPRMTPRLNEQDDRLPEWRDRTQHHPNGRRLRISYIVDGDWSRNKANKPISKEDATTWRERLMRQAEIEFGGQPYLYLVNKSDEGMARECMPSGRELPHSPHGLNDFQHIDRVVIPAACLPSPEHVRFAANQSVSQEELITSMHRLTVYQAVCRSSIRDLTCDRPVEFLVPDETTAKWLANWWPGCTVGQAGWFGHQWHGNRKHADLSSAHRMAERRRVKAELAEQIQADAVRSVLAKMGAETSDETLSYKEGLSHESSPNSDQIWAGTAFESRLDADIDRYRQGPIHKSDFIAALAELASQPVPDKERQVLLSPALFVDRPDPARPEKPRRRGRHNVACVANLVMIDVDGGRLAYTAWPTLFPDLEFVIHPTHSALDEFQYHVILFLDRPVTARQYEHIARRIKWLIEQAGYAAKPGANKPHHGIDASKLAAENMMYLPSRPQKMEPYFVHHHGKPINVQRWCSAGIKVADLPPPPPEPEVKPGIRKKATEIDRHIADYAAIPAGAGQRNGAFGRLAFRLRKLGLDDYDLSRHLRQADTDGHQAREGQIEQLVRNTRKVGPG